MPMEPGLARMLDSYLGLKLWAIVTRPIVPFETMVVHLKAHLEHQVALERRGVLFAAGPCHKPGEPHPDFGLIIIRAEDEAEARRIADSDPLHAHGARAYELYQWTLNEGRLQVSLDLSDQTCRLT